MMELPHLGFILAAYGITLAVLGGTALAVVLDGRAQKRALGELEHHKAARGPAAPEAGKAR